MAEDRVQRRLAAILLADLVGYSRLTSRDEIGTLRRVQTVFRDVVAPRVEGHEGRVVRMRGDDVLAEFPSAVEALRCAISIQQELAERNAHLPAEQRLELRIGASIGDIVIDGSDLHGDGVNLAARLQGLAEAGGICLSGPLHEQVKNQLACPFESLGARALKNFIDPISVYALSPKAITALPWEAVLPGRRVAPRRWVLQAAAAALVVLAGTGLWMFWPAREASVIGSSAAVSADALPLAARGPVGGVPAVAPSAAARLSLVVLPFSNSPGDPEQEYFADGISKDLTTDLSRIPGSFVIAPNTARAYKGRSIDVRQIGRELSVRYVLAGDVRRIEESVRINAQLVDAETASQLWAERFDGNVAQLAKVQDVVTRRIAGALNVMLVEAESQRAQRERPDNPDAVDLTMRGLALLNKPASQTLIRQARDLFEKAIALSPDHLPALIGLAQVLQIEWSSTWYLGTSKEQLQAMEAVVNKALAIKPDDAMATYLHGYVLKRLQLDLHQALAASEQAIALDPNLAVAHNYVGQIKMFLGRAAEAPAHTLKAIQLSPRDPQLAEWYYQLALDHIHLGQFEQAVEWGRRATGTNPNLRFPYRALAAALALAGQVDEAKMVAAEMLRRYPNETVGAFLLREPWDSPSYRAGQALEVKGMRLAGIPD